MSEGVGLYKGCDTRGYMVHTKRERGGKRREVVERKEQ